MHVRICGTRLSLASWLGPLKMTFVQRAMPKLLEYRAELCVNSFCAFPDLSTSERSGRLDIHYVYMLFYIGTNVHVNLYRSSYIVHVVICIY